jgi:hypothetical protein
VTGEGLQKIIALLRAVTESPTPSLVEEEAPFQNMYMLLEKTKIWSWVPTGPKITNDCAGEDQY